MRNLGEKSLGFFSLFINPLIILYFIFSLFSCHPLSRTTLEPRKPSLKRIRYASDASLEKRIKKFPKVRIANLPTPLEKMNNLSEELKGPMLFIKRDDETGLALGGNKARKLEFILADMMRKKCNMVITSAGVQSNWCRQTAAAARKFGIIPVLVLFKRGNTPHDLDGNLLLDHILGAEIRIIEGEEGKTLDAEEIIKNVAEEKKREGYNPYLAPVGGSLVGGSMRDPLGAISYTNAFLEIYREAKKKKIKIDYIVLATGSGGTQAGLIVGAKALGNEIKIIGISVSREKDFIQRLVSSIASDTARALKLKMSISAEEVIVFDDYVGEGYGVLNEETTKAIRLVAEKEGIILDPVYTGKAMAGLIDLIRKGYFLREDNVVFLHTGGTPALFVYDEELIKYLELKKDNFH